MLTRLRMGSYVLREERDPKKLKAPWHQFFRCNYYSMIESAILVISIMVYPARVFMSFTSRKMIPLSQFFFVLGKSENICNSPSEWPHLLQHTCKFQLTRVVFDLVKVGSIGTKLPPIVESLRLPNVRVRNWQRLTFTGLS